jgi:hypothetical protein
VADGERDNETLKENVKLPSTIFGELIIIDKVSVHKWKKYHISSEKICKSEKSAIPQNWLSRITGRESMNQSILVMTFFFLMTVFFIFLSCEKFNTFVFLTASLLRIARYEIKESAVKNPKPNKILLFHSNCLKLETDSEDQYGDSPERISALPVNNTQPYKEDKNILVKSPINIKTTMFSYKFLIDPLRGCRT